MRKAGAALWRSAGRRGFPCALRLPSKRILRVCRKKVSSCRETGSTIRLMRRRWSGISSISGLRRTAPEHLIHLSTSFKGDRAVKLIPRIDTQKAAFIESARRAALPTPDFEARCLGAKTVIPAPDEFKAVAPDR